MARAPHPTDSPLSTAPRPAILQLCAVDFTAHHFLLPLMRAQRAAGFDVHLACAPGAYLPQIAAEGFTVHSLPFERSFNLPAHLRAYRALGRLLRHQRFAVVHTHTPVASMIARPAARRAGVPLVLYTAHGFYFHDDMKPWVRRAHILLERLAQRWADYLFTQSREDLETAIREKIAPAERARAIGNGIDMTRFDPERYDPDMLNKKRHELGLEDAQGPFIVIIGRLVREKGYFEFLEALARLRERFPDLKALVIGKALESDHDDSAAQIHAAVARLQLENHVVFCGLRADVAELLALADLYTLPSWREGMPRSLIEAMAMRLPVVASNIRGCREEVVEGETGFLVPVRDAQALAEALTKLLDDPSLRRRLGEAGRRRALQEFDEQVVIQRQMDVMKSLFEEKKLTWPSAS